MRASLLLAPLLASACVSGAVAPGGPDQLGVVTFSLDGEAGELRVHDLPLGQFASSAILDLSTSIPTVALIARPAERPLDEGGPEIDLFGYLTSYPAPGALEDAVLGVRTGPDGLGGEGEIVVESLSVVGLRGRLTGRFSAEVCTSAPTDAAPPPTMCRDLAGRFDTAIEVRGLGG